MRRDLAALRLFLGALLLALSGVLLAQTGLVSSAAAAATTVAAALLCRAFIVTAAWAGPVVPGRIRTAIRDRERRTAFLAQRDPNASGRPRPRAPGCLVPTTA